MNFINAFIQNKSIVNNSGSYCRNPKTFAPCHLLNNVGSKLWTYADSDVTLNIHESTKTMAIIKKTLRLLHINFKLFNDTDGRFQRFFSGDTHLTVFFLPQRYHFHITKLYLTLQHNIFTTFTRGRIAFYLQKTHNNISCMTSLRKIRGRVGRQFPKCAQ